MIQNLAFFILLLLPINTLHAKSLYTYDLPPYIHKNDGFLYKYLEQYLETNDTDITLKVLPYKRAVIASHRKDGAYFPSNLCEEDFIQSSKIFSTSYIFITRSNESLGLTLQEAIDTKKRIIGVLGNNYNSDINELLKNYRSFRKARNINVAALMLESRRTDYLIIDKTQYLLNYEVFQDRGFDINLEHTVDTVDLFVCYTDSFLNEELYGKKLTKYTQDNKIADFLFDFIIENHDLDFSAIDMYFSIE